MFTIIRYVKNAEGEIVKQFFCNDEEWHYFGNDAMFFKTQQDAKQFYMDRPIFFADHKRTYTQGPKGGQALMGDVNMAKACSCKCCLNRRNRK